MRGAAQHIRLNTLGRRGEVHRDFRPRGAAAERVRRQSARIVVRQRR